MLIPLATITAAIAFLAPQDATDNSRPRLTPEQAALAAAVSPARAEEHLRILTQVPHMAGTPADKETALYVQRVLDEAGFDTRLEEYLVYLPYPVDVRLELTHPVPQELDLREQPFAWQADTLAKNPEFTTFNGYSASATVDAEVVYAFYGEKANFDWLASQGVDVTGKICLIRYGRVFRGLKVREAAARGAAGVLLYSEPDDDGYPNGDVYPGGPFRPRSGVQRGSIMYISEIVGDPLTPGVAATADAERLTREQATWLPSIPCIPISWGNALRIFEELGGQNVPADWQGGCPTTYHTGPGPVRVKMSVEMDEQLRPIWNVIGSLRTERTSDKFVLVGNHRDAWVYGAIDPSSGTAASLEAMRSLGQLVADGWHPRIEIRYASWDAEEQGLIGSTEHAEQHREDLQLNCLAYFNCDSAVSGPNFSASSTPELVDILTYVAARTTTHDGQARILERWAPDGSPPPIGNLGSGSDYTAFLCHLGIPALNVSSGGGHGLYHSMFDNFEAVSTHIDPGFEIHAAMARFLALAVHHFASASVPPIDLAAIGPYLETCAETLVGLGDEPRSALLAAIERFRVAADRARATEELMIAMHGAFLDEVGLPGRAWYRNLLVAPGLDLGYGATVMPGIAEALADSDTVRVRAEVERLVVRIDAATAILSR